MDYISTFMGEAFTPLAPDIEQIHIEDIAHALSLMCRANGHFVRFYSVAQHSINCANEAKARGLSERVQLACLLHDASEAYLSDITKPVKKHLSDYREIENRLQAVIYTKFLGLPLSDEESSHVHQIDHDILVCEFDALMKMKVFDALPNMMSKPDFDFRGFLETETEFTNTFMTIRGQTPHGQKDVRTLVSELERNFLNKGKNTVLAFVDGNKITEIFTEKLYIKKLSAQVDTVIHAYGILLSLPKILDDDETIEYLSLGAGNTGKPFDLSTSKRIAEFKFAKWDTKNNTIRQNKIFENFLELAIDVGNVGKKKYIYCLSAEEIIKFLTNSERALSSVLSRSSINKKHPDIQSKYKTVKEFYKDYKHGVEIVDLNIYLDFNGFYGIDG